MPSPSGSMKKRKPLSVNRYTISDTFCFAEEIQNLVIDQIYILASRDVTSPFTDVPPQETIETIAEKAFVDNWFNVTHMHLNITKPNLLQLSLEVAAMNQLFQFDGKLLQTERRRGNGLLLEDLEVLKVSCKPCKLVFIGNQRTPVYFFYQSDVDKRYEKSLLKTMLNRVFPLSSTCSVVKFYSLFN